MTTVLATLLAAAAGVLAFGVLSVAAALAIVATAHHVGRGQGGAR